MTGPGEISIAARLDRLPVTIFHFQLLGISAASLLFDTLDGLTCIFVLTHLRPIWGFGVSTIGVVSALGLSGYLVGTALCGFAADRLGRRRTILWTLLLYSLFSVSRGWATSVTELAALNFITFIFIGAESSIVPAFLAEFWPARVRGRMNGAVMMFFGLGIALAPLWSLLIIPRFGWRWAFFLTAPFALLAALMRYALPESPRWLAETGRVAEADKVLKAIECRVERESRRPLPPPVAAVRESDASRSEFRPADLLMPQFRRITLMLWAAWFAEFSTLYLFQTFVPTILANEGYAIVKSFAYSAAIYGAMVPAYLIGGQIAEWIDRKYAVLLAFCMMGIGGTCFGLSTQPWQFMLFGAMTTFFCATGSAAIYTYTPELYPTTIRVTGMGIASAWGRVGAVVVLLTFGFLYSTYGKSLLFVISDSVLLAGAAAVSAFGPLTRARPLEQISRGLGAPKKVRDLLSDKA